MTPEQCCRVEYLIYETRCSMAMAVDAVVSVDRILADITLDPNLSLDSVRLYDLLDSLNNL
jgi:hypothetical protein